MANHDKRREATSVSGNAESMRTPEQQAAVNKAAAEIAAADPTATLLAQPAPKPRALLWSVKVRDGELLIGTSDEIQPHAPGPQGSWDIVVCGPSVLLVPPAGKQNAHAQLRGSGGNGPSAAFAELAGAHGMPDGAQKSFRIAHELPRSACTIRWLVPADATAEQMAEMVFGKSFATPVASPDGRVLEFRRERAAKAETQRKAPKAKPELLTPAEEEDDGFEGSGPAGEAA